MLHVHSWRHVMGNSMRGHLLSQILRWRLHIGHAKWHHRVRKVGHWDHLLRNATRRWKNHGGIEHGSQKTHHSRPNCYWRKLFIVFFPENAEETKNLINKSTNIYICIYCTKVHLTSSSISFESS